MQILVSLSGDVIQLHVARLKREIKATKLFIANLERNLKTLDKLNFPDMDHVRICTNETLNHEYSMLTSLEEELKSALGAH